MYMSDGTWFKVWLGHGGGEGVVLIVGDES